MDGQVSIGERFRRRREERGLSAEEAASQSKIPLRMVHVLESGDYHLVPDLLYVVRFVHDYAVFLGLDAGAIDAEFERILHQPLRTPTVPTPTRPTAPRVRWKRVLWPAVAVVAIFAVVVMAMFAGVGRSPDQAAPHRPSAARMDEAASSGGSAASAAGAVSDPVSRPTTAAAPPVPDAPVAPASVTSVRRPAPEAKPSLPSGSSRHVLVVRAEEPTWLSVRADSKDRREVLLQGGQTVRFEAETDFHVIVGNAGGVTLSFDGTPLPPLGRSGEVIRNLVLPPPRRDSSPPDPAASSSTR